jgi:hypothetical protein
VAEAPLDVVPNPTAAAETGVVDDDVVTGAWEVKAAEPEELVVGVVGSDEVAELVAVLVDVEVDDVGGWLDDELLECVCPVFEALRVVDDDGDEDDWDEDDGDDGDHDDEEGELKLPEFSPDDVEPPVVWLVELLEPVGYVVTPPVVESSPVAVPESGAVLDELPAATTPGEPAPPLVPATAPPEAPTATVGTPSAEDGSPWAGTMFDAGCCAPPPDWSWISPSAPSFGTTAAIGLGKFDEGRAMNQIAPTSNGTVSAAPRIRRPRAACWRRSSSRTSRRCPMPRAGVRPEDTGRDPPRRRSPEPDADRAGIRRIT